MTKRSVAVCAAAILMVCGAAVRCGAQTVDAREAMPATSVPRLVQFNGTLKDSAARPVSGVASVTFAIYAEQDGGSALWTETQNVLADSNGHFNAQLGTSTMGGFPSEVFATGASRWLGVTIARQPEMPRVMLASVPYAMKAGDADTLGGLPASSYVTAQQLAARTAAPSTTLIASPSVVAGTPTVGVSAASQDATGASAQSVTQAAVTGTGTANYLPLWTSGTNLGVSKIYQANGGFVGINTNTPLLQLDVNGNSIFRGSFQMAPQGTATASAGQPSHSFQWQGSVYNSSTHAAQNEAFGFRTVPATNNTSAPTTQLDLFYGPGGGTLNDLGLSISNTGVVTFVPAQTFTASSAAFTQLNLTPTGGITPALSIDGVGYLGSYGPIDSTYVGATAGGAFTETNSASEDTGMGYASLFHVTTGSQNTAFGAYSMETVTTGSGNTGVGNAALISTNGNNNTAVGTDALENDTDGTLDTAVGQNAGASLTTGEENTFLGANTSITDPTFNQATVIGWNAVAGEGDAMILGPTGELAVRVGVNTSTPKYTFEVDDAGFNIAGIYGVSNIVGDAAVYGNSTATSGKGSNGGMFSSVSPNGSGVAAFNDAGGYASYFEATHGGFAGYFNGNVTVSGTLTKGGGSFKIDDPIDPAGKYLSHSFVESPDMMNIYNGTVTLDAHGRAVVTMPDWFSALNRDFQYQLTAIGAPGPKLYIAAEMQGNQFAIGGGKKGMRVSWMVTGIRQDAWANAHRIPNEEAKPENEQGRYLHPELFGAGPEQQIGTQTAPAAARSQAALPANAHATRTTGTDAGQK